MRGFAPSRAAVGPVLVAIVLGQALLWGCATTPRGRYSSGVTVPRTVAVMPLANQTNSVPGAARLREYVHRDLERNGYVAQPLFETDRVLSNQFGISLGDQVTDELIPEIGATLRSDAVMTGAIFKIGGMVDVALALHESRTGRRIWESRFVVHTRMEFRRMPDGSMAPVGSNPETDFRQEFRSRLPAGPGPGQATLWERLLLP